MKTCPSFWPNPFLSANGIGSLEDEICLAQRIADRPAAIRRGKVESIRHRTAPIGTALKGGQSVAHTQDTANVASVTVGVPSAGVDDRLCTLKVALTIEQAQDDQAMIRNDVAVAAIFIIAIM